MMINKVLFIFIVLRLQYVIHADESFDAICLKAHNNYRKLHGVPDLILNSTVQAYAQEWANNLAATKVFKHRPKPKYGENLYMRVGFVHDVEGIANAAVDAWYKEISFYDWNKPGFSMKTGHFTQVVWKSSTALGCAYAINGSYVYVAANYNPPGNYAKKFTENVPKLL